jgi:hypothetical protein
VANHYTTLTFSVQFDGTDDELALEIRKLGVLADLNIARVEVTNSYDDGQTVRISCRLDADEAYQGMQALVAMTDIVTSNDAKMITSSHEEPFDDQALWPAEHVAMAMEERGIHPLNVEFNVDPWFPSTLVQSLVAEALTDLLRPDPDDPVHGVSLDRTMPGFPSFRIWVEEDTYHTLHDKLVPTVETWIADLAGDPHLSRWLKQVYMQYVTSDS